MVANAGVMRFNPLTSREAAFLSDLSNRIFYLSRLLPSF